jgi:hypothetical protein
MRIETWDSCLWMSFLDYFSVVASSCTWDPSFLDCFSVATSACTWDPGFLDYLSCAVRTRAKISAF